MDGISVESVDNLVVGNLDPPAIRNQVPSYERWTVGSDVAVHKEGERMPGQRTHIHLLGYA